MTVCAVVLAAGLGSRFRGPEHKLLAVLDGRPVVYYAVAAALESGLDDVLVVTGAVDIDGVLEAFGARVRRVVNPRYELGQATSLDRGIGVARELGHRRAVVGLGDQPFVTAAAWSAVGVDDAPISVATYQGRRGNPVGLADAVWPLLPTGGDQGARALLRGRPELVHPVACEGQPDDIDTVEDLRRWS